jgi:hypothetical protein
VKFASVVRCQVFHGMVHCVLCAVCCVAVKYVTLLNADATHCHVWHSLVTEVGCLLLAPSLVTP